MTKFEDQLFEDLIREHGSALNTVTMPKQHARTGRALLAAGVGGIAVAAAAGVLVAIATGHGPGASAGTDSAYAVTNNPDGTITLAVYQQSGIAAANAKLHELGDSQVHVVPVAAGCPSITSLPAAPLNGHLAIQTSMSVKSGGSVTVNAKGIPAGDILVVGVETTSSGDTTTSLGASKLTSAPAPSCVSLPSGPLPPGKRGTAVTHGTGSGPTMSSNG
jgi:hypothetical protein